MGKFLRSRVIDHTSTDSSEKPARHSWRAGAADGNCVSCGKHIQTTGGCMDCQQRLGQYVSTPSITVTPSVVIVNPPVAMCPHMRSDWRHCPHCRGL